MHFVTIGKRSSWFPHFGKDTTLFRKPIGKDFDRQCALTRAEIQDEGKILYIIKCGTVGSRMLLCGLLNRLQSLLTAAFLLIYLDCYSKMIGNPLQLFDGHLTISNSFANKFCLNCRKPSYRLCPMY